MRATIKLRKMATTFQITSTTQKGRSRLGHLTLPPTEEPLPTPAFFIHTSGGLPPHVTPDILNLIYPSSLPPLLITIDSCLTFTPSVSKYGEGIAKFIGLPNHPVFLSCYDPLRKKKEGYNVSKTVAFWGRMGKQSLCIEDFKEIVTAFKPSIGFQSLHDYDVREGSGKKRVKKSLSKSAEYLEKLEDVQGMFVSLEAAWFLGDDDDDVMKNIVQRGCAKGYVISGFEEELDEKGWDLLEKILLVLPSDKPRYVPGARSLGEVLRMVGLGVDLFDSSVVSGMAGRGEVFVLEDFGSGGGVVEELQHRGEGHRGGGDEGGDRVISIKDKRYFSDFSPVSKTCSCYTCRNHTRAYLNHLFATDELLGPVLAMIHNLTSFETFFAAIRRSIDNLEELQRRATTS